MYPVESKDALLYMAELGDVVFLPLFPRDSLITVHDLPWVMREAGRLEHEQVNSRVQDLLVHSFSPFKLGVEFRTW